MSNQSANQPINQWSIQPTINKSIKQSINQLYKEYRSVWELTQNVARRFRNWRRLGSRTRGDTIRTRTRRTVVACGLAARVRLDQQRREPVGVIPHRDTGDGEVNLKGGLPVGRVAHEIDPFLGGTAGRVPGRSAHDVNDQAVGAGELHGLARVEDTPDELRVQINAHFLNVRLVCGGKEDK